MASSVLSVSVTSCACLSSCLPVILPVTGALRATMAVQVPCVNEALVSG